MKIEQYCRALHLNIIYQIQIVKKDSKKASDTIEC